MFASCCCVRRKSIILVLVSTLLIFGFACLTEKASALNSPAALQNGQCFALSDFDMLASRRAMQEDVLDTYYTFYCYSNRSHSVSVMYPTYKSIVFKNSYSRVYPDTCLSSFSYPCPTCKVDGLMKVFQCNYQIR